MARVVWGGLLGVGHWGQASGGQCRATRQHVPPQAPATGARQLGSLVTLCWSLLSSPLVDHSEECSFGSTACSWEGSLSPFRKEGRAGTMADAPPGGSGAFPAGRVLWSKLSQNCPPLDPSRRAR